MKSEKETCYDCVFYDLSIHVPGKTQRCGMDDLIYPGDKANQLCDTKFIPRKGGVALNNIKKKHKTHLVFKIEDLEKALDEKELRVIHALDETILKYRKGKGKSTMGYLVINRDEPYVDLIQAEVLAGERSKRFNAVCSTLLQAMKEMRPFTDEEKMNLKKLEEGHHELEEEEIQWIIFLNARTHDPVSKVKCTFDMAMEILNNSGGKYIARIYEDGKLLLSDRSASMDVLNFSIDTIPFGCLHGDPAGDCGTCAVGDPMSFHLSEGEREQWQKRMLL